MTLSFEFGFEFRLQSATQLSPCMNIHFFNFCFEIAKIVQADRAISTSQLQASRLFHTWPINVMVYHGSQGKPGFEVGFTLRCFQRLSRPHLATQLRHWRDDWCTRGASIPVLSY